MREKYIVFVSPPADILIFVITDRFSTEVNINEDLKKNTMWGRVLGSTGSP
jgi:hypothetical protein